MILSNGKLWSGSKVLLQADLQLCCCQVSPYLWPQTDPTEAEEAVQPVLPRRWAAAAGGRGHGLGQWSVVTTFPPCTWQSVALCLQFSVWRDC